MENVPVLAENYGRALLDMQHTHARAELEDSCCSLTTDPLQLSKTAEFRPPSKMTADVAPAAPDWPLQLPTVARDYLEHLLRLELLSPTEVTAFLQRHTERLDQLSSADQLNSELIGVKLLTPYQADRIVAGTTHGLILGNYRVLGRLGAGGMGVVFLGEHTLMNRRVAIKVLPVDDDCSPVMLHRFYAEIQVLAKLHHPNIVMAFDSGTLDSEGPGLPMLIYLVMELLDGCDLELHAQTNGPISIATACRWISQAACGLQEAHNRSLIHRDVKPSNMILTKDDRIKLVDFGLARQLCQRLTDPSSLLGTLDFMAPEQSYDPTAVDSQADIYALGASLFWLITGEPPYGVCRSLNAGLQRIQREPPRRLRSLCPKAPPELEAVVDRMLDRNPSRRPAMAIAVTRLLEPFCQTAV